MIFLNVHSPNMDENKIKIRAKIKLTFSISETQRMNEFEAPYFTD